MAKSKADLSEEQLEIQAKRLMAKEKRIKLDSNRVTHLHPSVMETLDLEKKLVKISTQSVVSLMNRIRVVQKNVKKPDWKVKKPVKKPTTQLVVDSSVSKLNFLDMLRSNMQAQL